MSLLDRLEEIRRSIADVASRERADLRDAIVGDGDDYLAASALSLQLWIGMRERGELTAEEVESLVRGLDDLATMHRLTQAGLTAVALDRIREAIIQAVIVAAGKVA